MKLPVLKVAVVGHTNTGKTSLLRTLTRDVAFGEVSNRPAVTRHVEGTALLVRGEPLVELYDTPGLEDSIGLLDRIEHHRGRHRGGVEEIRQFLESQEARKRFTQEAKVLGQVLESDVVLYVIDVRDRVLGKHRDELEILGRLARPVVPVLNFTASEEARTETWRQHLARVNLHAVAEFDTVVFDQADERRLFEKMRTLLDRHGKTLDALITERREERSRLVGSSVRLVAELLVDAAAYAVTVPTGEAKQVEDASNAFKDRIRERERRCVDELLQLHRFRPEDCVGDELLTVDGQWGLDLFSAAALKQFGFSTGSAAAAGAVFGLAIDAAVGFMSLGAATAAGAAVGALFGLARDHGKRVLARLRGYGDLRCNDATLLLLLNRQLWLIETLARRGHASQQPIQIEKAGTAPTRVLARELPGPVGGARLKPAWSTIEHGPAAVEDPGRTTVVGRVAEALTEVMEAG